MSSFAHFSTTGSLNDGDKPLPIITKHSILDVTAALDPPRILMGGLYE